MKNLAIIPARAGSKRIPRKNIKNFLGKPIIAYSIQTALETNLFEEVMVSTDDEMIADIAEKYGARVPFLRSKKNANDLATTMDVLKETEQMYKHLFNAKFDFICCIYATAPLMQSNDLVNGFGLLTEKQYSSVFPVVEYSYPIWRGLRINAEDKIEMVWKEHLNARSQDLEKVYHDAGQWYWYNPGKIQNSIFTNNTGYIILSEENVQDIDSITDWKLAQIKYELLQNSK